MYRTGRELTAGTGESLRLAQRFPYASRLWFSGVVSPSSRLEGSFTGEVALPATRLGEALLRKPVFRAGFRH